jgi:hypothetical protein
MASSACVKEIFRTSYSQKATVVIVFEPSGTFIAQRPEWTLQGALLGTPDGRSGRVVEERPFEFSDGAWQATINVVPIEPIDGMRTLSVAIRVTNDTARRWKEIGINPFLEARAQLRDHWKSMLDGGGDTLTLL